MKLQLEVNNRTYIVSVETGCYTLARLEAVQDPKSKNYGQVVEKSLGQYPMNLSAAVNKIIRIEAYEDSSTKTLQEYATWIDNARKQVTQQLEGLES